MKKKLYKSEKNKMVCGVCSGIAEYFNCDPTIIRLIAVIICLFKGFGLLLYILAVIIIPSENLKGVDVENMSEEDIDNMKSAHINQQEENTSEEAPHTDEEFDSFFKKRK